MINPLNLLLPFKPALQVDAIELNVATNCFEIELHSRSRQASCPSCHQRSRRVHSYYRRTVTDLPWADSGVTLRLRVRKFRCLHKACDQQVFCERLAPEALSAWGRKTDRLREQQRQIGLALGSAAGARLSQALNRPASATTLLRLIRATPSPPAATPRVLGVDDFAKRKGQRYGTVLVDLERQVPIALLADRDADTLASWLAAHPGVEIIARDRAGAYADGARQGAPQALQVADRFHLVRNLADVLRTVFETQAQALSDNQGSSAPPEVPAPLIDPMMVPANSEDTDQTTPVPMMLLEPASTPAAQASQEHQRATSHTPPEAAVPLIDPMIVTANSDEINETAAPVPVILPTPASTPTAQARQEQQRADYEQAKQLHVQGWTLAAIAQQLGLNRQTVRRYLRADTFPQKRRPPSQLDPYKPYLLERWNAGCRTGTVLLQEIQQQGYRGKATVVFDYISRLRQAQGLPPRSRAFTPEQKPISDSETEVLTPRQAVWLVIGKPENRSEDDQLKLEKLTQTSSVITQAVELTQSFLQRLRQRQAERFDDWLEQAANSELAPFRGFAKSLRSDYEAVKAAFTLCWSTGPVEGQINRLKMLKRQMFGRAKLDLLEKRFLPAA